jgi:hypothetical protein
MANWIYKLELKDLWEQRDKGKITISELAKAVADRIEKATFFKIKTNEEALREIVMDFEGCDDDVEEFDSILEQLYDWADTPLRTPLGKMQRKMCWINTF